MRTAGIYGTISAASRPTADLIAYSAHDTTQLFCNVDPKLRFAPLVYGTPYFPCAATCLAYITTHGCLECGIRDAFDARLDDIV
jgi:hypothetical protein